jgi:hypothetical protein
MLALSGGIQAVSGARMRFLAPLAHECGVPISMCFPPWAGCSAGKEGDVYGASRGLLGAPDAIWFCMNFFGVFDRTPVQPLRPKILMISSPLPLLPYDVTFLV